jgi:hypothetical protein
MSQQRRLEMKSILVAVAITLIAGSVAVAAPKRASDRARGLESRAMVVETESYDVYVNGRLIGRDPDPAIRAQLRNDHHLITGY